MRLGIKDIAKAAGVSTATVSNVLNGKKNVSSETRGRILSLCQEMGYETNPLGRNLKQGENTTVLFLFSDFDREFYLKIIHGINDYVESRGFDLIVSTSKSGERYMNRKNTCGCILLDMRCTDEFLLENASPGYPIIALDRVIEEPYIKSFVVNNYDPMRELMQGLVDKGYRKFGYLAGVDTLDNKERYKAFSDVLNENHISFDRNGYTTGDFRESSGIQAARLMLVADKMPEVLVCANDNMAIGAMRVFRKEGIRVPQDIAVTGFDGTTMAEIMGITTVSIPNYERGYLAAQSLMEILEGKGDFSVFKISAKVKWRTSVI